MKYKINFIAIFLLTLLLPLFSQASVLSMTASPVSVDKGQNFSVRVSVNTLGKSINNTEAVIFYPSNLVDVVSVSRASSVFSLWVEEPSYSNALGRLSWNAGIPNPGFSGSSGTVFNVTFRAKNTGTAVISFGDAFIRANDGLGTDILSGKNGISVNIKEPIPKPEPPKDPEPVTAPPKPVTEEPAPEAKPTPEVVLPPQISVSSTEINKGAWVTVFGKSSTGPTKIRLNLEYQDGQILENVVDVTSDGFFSYSTNKLKDTGRVSIWATEIMPDGSYRLVSEKIYLDISDKNLVRIDISRYVLIYLAITWIIMVFLLILGWYKYFHLRHQISEKRRKIE